MPHTATGKVDPRTLPAPEYGSGRAEGDEPANYVEVQLIQLWEKLLGVEGIGPKQSFFDLGGNSFLALRLFAQVNRRLECDLPVATLFAGATVRHMADAIRRQKRSAAGPAAPVVPLQPNGTFPPLFFVHSADRNVMGYVSLVRHLGADQPSWGLRDVGEDMGRPLADIAAEHVRAMRTVQPRGPYYLCGWSFGGFVVFEMAAQLERQGETVAFVGLLDTMSPVLEQAWPRGGAAEMAVGVAAEEAKRNRRTFVMDPGALAGMEPDEQFRRVVDEMRAQDAAPPGFDAGRLQAACQVLLDRYRSRALYVPGSFSGTLTLFQAAEAPSEHDEFYAHYTPEEARTLGWCRHATRPVEVITVPGSHPTIASEPNVSVLARHMRESLAAARERADAAARIAAAAG